jgi:hypothetical protein
MDMTTRSSQKAVSRFKIADPRSEIPPAERDRALLAAGSWPTEIAQALKKSIPHAGWEERDGNLFRYITVHGEGENAKSHELWEAMLRFPNASLYATHQLPKKPFRFDPWPNLHTMRVLGKGEPGAPIKHVYLLHNGLNETNDLLFHYRLAAWILDERSDAVCILRPLPGHLTRYPFNGPYEAKPLDDYLRDPADLFRQFVRYMLETQWLLSALVPRSQYLTSAGTLLLREAAPRGGTSPKRTGRADDANLAKAMAKAWRLAFASSEDQQVSGEPGGEQANEEQGGEQAGGEQGSKQGGEQVKRAGESSGHSKEPVTQPTMQAAITGLRELLGWKPELSARPPQTQRADGGAADPEPPCIHVVGYSMGGFVAQAVFFAWPFAVSSCTNMFAGGALRDLAPTAFAHPEEWQAVLHGMRYELDRAFRDQYLSPSDGLVAGVEQSVFGYFTRIFYEVFLQYYRGGYASRVSEFSRRLLFVVGGDDPIVRTKNVLDAGPPQGMTLLQIADVSHFPGGRLGGGPDGGKVESEQRMYWLPEVGRVIANFSERAEGLLHRTLAESWGVYRGRQSQESQESDAPADAPSSEQYGDRDPTMLDSAAFAKEMSTLVKLIKPTSEKSKARGWLLIGRNEVPPAFLEHKAFLAYAQAVHHSDDEITSYIKVLRARAQGLIAGRDRVSLLIPRKSEQWFTDRTERERFLSKSETASAARIPDQKTATKMWEHFEQEWLAKGAVGRVAPKEYSPDELGELGIKDAERLGVKELPLASLPDVWIALSPVVCAGIFGSKQSERKENEDAVVDWAIKLVEEWALEHAERQGSKPATKRAGKSEESQDDDDVRSIGQLKTWIEDGNVLAIQVSAAELNSRFRGRRLLKAKDVRKAIIHWALAYNASDLSKSS